MRITHFLIFVFLILALPATSLAQIGMSITVAPPELVAYSQPMCPQSGYLWTPGYWAYGDEGYFWVPGTWVEPPALGLLWTPGYWGWGDNAYAWNEGYWGSTIGFYGGVNYGFGYGGVGYEGGYWNHGAFNYNRSVNNVDVRNFHNTYEKTVNSERAGNHVSYNGGSGGLSARPTAAEETAGRERHTPATGAQTGHQQAASKNHELLASVNHGRPPIAATSAPGEFTGKGVVAANGTSAETKTSENKAAATRSNENKAAENKAAATRSNENKAAHSKPAAARQQTAPRPAARKESAPRPAPAVRAQAAPRPQAAPRAEKSRRQENKGPGGKEKPRR